MSYTEEFQKIKDAQYKANYNNQHSVPWYAFAVGYYEGELKRVLYEKELLKKEVNNN